MLGHLYPRQPAREAHRSRALELWSRREHSGSLRQIAGVEIMRRLIGVAQLPLGYGIDKKRELLELSQKLVLAA